MEFSSEHAHAHRYRHFGQSRTFWIFFWVLVVAAAVMAVYLLGIHGYLPWSRHPATTTLEVDMAIIDQTPSGSTWQEHRTLPGTPISYPVLSGSSITGIARAGSSVLVLGATAQGASTLYEYANGAYQPIYQNSARLSNVSVSSDGTLAIVSALPTGTGYPQILAVSLSSGTATPLGYGLSPILLSSGTTHSVLYLASSSVMEETFNGKTWTTPVVVYKSTVAFPAGGVLVTDGSHFFTFVDPVTGSYQQWVVKSWNPFVGSPLHIYSPSGTSAGIPSFVPLSQLAYSGGNLWMLSSLNADQPTLTAISGPAAAVTFKLQESSSSLTRAILISP